MATSVVEALKAFNDSKSTTGNLKLALLTPYIKDVHMQNVQFLVDNGFDVHLDSFLSLDKDSLSSSLSPDSITRSLDEMINTTKENVDVIVIGCSALRVTQ